jgi:Protein of unknown function (DUF4245)
MVRSLGLMAIVVAAVLLLAGRALIFPGSARMPPVGYTDDVAGFRTLAGVPALAPAGLPASWRANAASLSQPRAGVVQLHVGWAVPGSAYAGLDEATGPGSAVIASVLGGRGAAVIGTTTIDGRSWQLRRSDRGEEALTLSGAPVTVVVTGSATDAQLRTLAGSLAPA